MAELREYVTLREIAAMLGVTKCRAGQIAKERGIEGARIGNMAVFHRSQVDRFTGDRRRKQA